ncbi:putative nucleoredoxin 1 [Apium graveolens]|uniref:putative nucleoredoxin 1 n=1 Tax=Apium graveolens TaxID=4045 RepID=UPI003D7BFE9E
MLGLFRNRCVWRAPLFSKATNTYTYTYNMSSTVNHRYLFSFLQVSHAGDYFTNKRLYPSEDDEEEIQGPDTKKKISKGDVIDLHDLLFTKNRDYLVRYQNNQQVKAEHLAAKVIAIYFTPIMDIHCMRYYVPLLENLHIKLYPQNGFEVVFVAVKVDADHDHVLHRDYCKGIEEEIFSLRPWTAIPLSDVPSEKSLQKRGFPDISGDIPAVLIVDSAGMVLQCHDAYYILELYGALGYPFSDERINYLQSEDDAIAMQPSLKNLLASSQRDYVISNKGDKIPIHTLEDKVVALYFYQEGETDDTQLKRAYNELKNNKENFEVVLIYIPRNFEFYCETEESFWKRFKTMPWLSLPFNDPSDTKLKRILEYSLKYMNHYVDPDQVTRLVIFGPHCEYIEPFGANILKEFGTGAYPFTFAKLVKVEIEKVNDMKLEMLWDRNKVFRTQDGSEVPVSQLCGKNVILFFESYFDSHKIEFLKILKERYVQCKGTCDEFEVIHILKEEGVVTKQIGYLPWVVCDEFSPIVDWNFFYVHDGASESFVFFDENGRMVRKTIWPSFENIDFPFCADGLEREAWVQLGHWFDWKSWYGSCAPCLGRARIYSLEKMNAPSSLSTCILNGRRKYFNFIIRLNMHTYFSSLEP